jgi:hypothetical protein
LRISDCGLKKQVRQRSGSPARTHPSTGVTLSHISQAHRWSQIRGLSIDPEIRNSQSLIRNPQLISVGSIQKKPLIDATGANLSHDSINRLRSPTEHTEHTEKSFSSVRSVCSVGNLSSGLNRCGSGTMGSKARQVCSLFGAPKPHQFMESSSPVARERSVHQRQSAVSHRYGSAVHDFGPDSFVGENFE